MGGSAVTVLDYSMYTDEGNQALARMVDGIKTLITEGDVRRRELPGLVRNACTQLAKIHAEVWDTEPQVAIGDALSEACAVEGWLPIHRDEW